MKEDSHSEVEVTPVNVAIQDFRPASELQRVLSVRQVGHWLRTAPESVARMASAGELPGQRCDGEWRFGAAAINEWLSGASRLTDRAETALRAVTEKLLELRDQTGVLADRLVEKVPVREVSGSASAIHFDLQEPITLDKVEEHYIRYVLERCEGSKSHAAQWLGIDASTLYRKLARYPWAR